MRSLFQHSVNQILFVDYGEIPIPVKIGHEQAGLPERKRHLPTFSRLHFRWAFGRMEQRSRIGDEIRNKAPISVEGDYRDIGASPHFANRQASIRVHEAAPEMPVVKQLVHNVPILFAGNKAIGFQGGHETIRSDGEPNAVLNIFAIMRRTKKALQFVNMGSLFFADLYRDCCLSFCRRANIAIEQESDPIGRSIRDGIENGLVQKASPWFHCPIGKLHGDYLFSESFLPIKVYLRAFVQQLHDRLGWAARRADAIDGAAFHDAGLKNGDMFFGKLKKIIKKISLADQHKSRFIIRDAEMAITIDNAPPEVAAIAKSFIQLLILKTVCDKITVNYWRTKRQSSSKSFCTAPDAIVLPYLVVGFQKISELIYMISIFFRQLKKYLFRLMAYISVCQKKTEPISGWFSNSRECKIVDCFSLFHIRTIIAFSGG